MSLCIIISFLQKLSGFTEEDQDNGRRRDELMYFVYIFPVLPYICLQSPTLVCPESSSPAHSLASLRKPECFSSCNSNTTLRFASTTTTTSTHYILNTIRRQEVSTVTGTIIDFLWKLNYPLHQATSTDSIQSIANVLQNRTKQVLADLCHYICAKRQHFRSEDVTLWKRQK